MTMRSRWADSNASPWTILIRLAVGLVVFFPEGIQKLIFPDILGAGRFAKIGIPAPEIMGPFVGVVELVCGALIIVGLFTRWRHLKVCAPDNDLADIMRTSAN